MDSEYRDASLALTALTEDLHSVMEGIAADQQLVMVLVCVDPIDASQHELGTFDARDFVRDMLTVLEIP